MTKALTMSRNLLSLLVLTTPLAAQWDTVTHQPANPVHTEGFLIVHDDGTNLMAFSAMAQEWMPMAPGGAEVVGTGDFCALSKLPSGELFAYSARLHDLQAAPVPAAGSVLEVQVEDDVVLAIAEDGAGGLLALGYSAQSNSWDTLALGAGTLANLEYGTTRFAASVTNGTLLGGFSARVPSWSSITNDSAQNLRLDGNTVVADVVPTPGSGVCAAAFSGVLGSWNVSPPTHTANVTELDHNVAWAMIDTGTSTTFRQAAYSAYTGSWIVSTNPYLEGNWTPQLSDNVVLLRDDFSDRYLAFGARPGNVLVPVPTNGPWSMVQLNEDCAVLKEIGTPFVHGFSGLCGTAFVSRTVIDPVTPLATPSHALHLRDAGGQMHSFGPAMGAWAAPVTMGPSALLHVDDAVHLVEDGPRVWTYSTRLNIWAWSTLWATATYIYAKGGSIAAAQEDMTTSGDLRIYNEAHGRWHGPYPQSNQLDMYPGRNLMMFVDSSSLAVSAYSTQTGRYTAPPTALTPGILAAASQPTVEENVAWFSDGGSVVAYGSPGEIHSWYQWPRGTEYQAWSGASPNRLASSIRTDGPDTTFWLGARFLLNPPLSLPPHGVLWLDFCCGFLLNGPRAAQPVGSGSTHLSHHGVNLPAGPSLCMQVWAQGIILPAGPPPWRLTGDSPEPAWIF